MIAPFPRRSIWLLPLTVSLLLLPGCRNRPPTAPPPVPVMTALAEIRPERLSLGLVGSVEPIESATVRAQVGGVIERVAFREGEEVRAGQLLFQIDPRPFQAALDATQAQLARDRAQAANAASQAKRYGDLVAKDFVTREQYDQVRTQAEMLAATVQVDEAAVRQARLNLGYASVTAPIGGRTGAVLVKRGNVVRAGEAALVVINQLSPIRVKLSIPGDQLPRVQHYAALAPLRVRLSVPRDTPAPSQGSLEEWGRITFLDNQVDPGTGTVTLKAEFANERGVLWPGQFVQTELVLTVEPNAVTVPAAAVVTGQEGTFVYVVGADRRVQKRTVRANRTQDGRAILEQGVIAGETVITDGQMRLKPGTEVAPSTVSPPPGSSR